jgi:hypothetical protein
MALHLPKSFVTNNGTASLEALGPESVRDIEINVTTLDQLIPDGTKVGVMKLDIEGHELAALEGASRLFESKAVRDLVFEEHLAPPTPVTKWLQVRGYALFQLDQPVVGPRLLPLTLGIGRRSRVDAPNCLATTEPERARERLQHYGWRVLASRAASKSR